MRFEHIEKIEDAVNEYGNTMKSILFNEEIKHRIQDRLDVDLIVSKVFMNVYPYGVLKEGVKDSKAYLIVSTFNAFSREYLKVRKQDDNEIILSEEEADAAYDRLRSTAYNGDPAVLYEHKMLYQEIMDCLALLPKRQREVAELRFSGELDYNEIAQQLHTTPGACRKAMSLAMNNLSKQDKCKRVWARYQHDFEVFAHFHNAA